MTSSGRHTAEPPLLALLICDSALKEDSGMVSVIRVIDTFYFDLELVGGTEKQLEEVQPTLKCQAYRERDVLG